VSRLAHAPVRIGIAGLGFGLDVHLPGFVGIENVEVTCLLGRDPVAATKAAAKTGLAVVTDLRAWFEHPLDAISVALPPDQVEGVVTAALDRGLPVLSEKPLGVSAQQAKLLASRSGDRPSAIDFEFAELETFMALRDLIRDGTIGSIRHAAILWLMESRAQRDRVGSWKTGATQSGGALTLMGTHFFYLAEWLLGPSQRLWTRLDSQVTARFQVSGEAADELIHVTSDHSSGAVSSLVAGNANPGVSLHRWTIVGDRGMAVLENASRDLANGFVLRVFGPDGQLLKQFAEPLADGDGRIPPFRRLAARFVDAVRVGDECRPNFFDGARVAFLTEAARGSADLGTWVAVAP
jgi:predicted dehydrogenase